MAQRKKAARDARGGMRTSPSDIQIDLGSGPLVSGLKLPKARADRAMAALLERARRAAGSPPAGHGRHVRPEST